MIHSSRSATQVKRGSSTPQASSVKFSGSEAKLGLESIFQFDTPSLLRATVRCEWPRRSSTRTRRIVSSPISQAPALNTVFGGEGQSCAVRIGLLGWRWNSSAYTFGFFDSRSIRSPLKEIFVAGSGPRLTSGDGSFHAVGKCLLRSEAVQLGPQI